MFLPAVDFQNFHMGIKFLSKKRKILEIKMFLIFTVKKYSDII